MLRAERYLKVEAGPDGLRVVVSLTLSPAEARRVLEAADRDGDGAVSRAEADRYLAEWGQGLRVELPAAVDGEPIELAWGEPFLDPIGPIGGAPGVVEMVALVPLGAGEHRIEITDRMRREAFDRTDVAFRARDGARLVACGPGREPTRPLTDYAFGGADAPPETERLTAVVAIPGSPADGTVTGVVAPLGVAAVVLGAGLVLVLSRRRRPRG